MLNRSFVALGLGLGFLAAAAAHADCDSNTAVDAPREAIIANVLTSSNLGSLEATNPGIFNRELLQINIDKDHPERILPNYRVTLTYGRRERLGFCHVLVHVTVVGIAIDTGGEVPPICGTSIQIGAIDTDCRATN